jgi:threonine/homoserine/homoserine lactone efflux protein
MWPGNEADGIIISRWGFEALGFGGAGVLVFAGWLMWLRCTHVEG